YDFELVVALMLPDDVVNVQEKLLLQFIDRNQNTDAFGQLITHGFEETDISDLELFALPASALSVHALQIKRLSHFHKTFVLLVVFTERGKLNTAAGVLDCEMAVSGSFLADPVIGRHDQSCQPPLSVFHSRHICAPTSRAVFILHGVIIERVSRYVNASHFFFPRQGLYQAPLPAFGWHRIVDAHRQAITKQGLLTLRRQILDGIAVFDQMLNKTVVPFRRCKILSP